MDLTNIPKALKRPRPDGMHEIKTSFTRKQLDSTRLNKKELQREFRENARLAKKAKP